MRLSANIRRRMWKPTILLVLGGLLILISYAVASLWLAIKEYLQ